MKEIKTVCTRDCYDSCGLIAKIDDAGRIRSVRGDPDHPVTRGLTCPRAAKDHERVYKNRVEVPVLREGNTFRRITWEKALEILSERIGRVLETHGPEALLYLAYAGNMGLLTELYPQRLWRHLGATRTDYALCSESGHRGLSLHYGHTYGIMPEELLRMDLIVFWGFNAAVSAPHIWSLAGEVARKRGTRIAVIDPIRTKTVEGANLWIRPMPGSDVALAYGIMNHLMRKDRVDHAFTGKWTQGYEALQKESLKWPLERVEAYTGVTGEQIEALAKLYDLHRPSATMIGIGLQKCDEGADQVRAVSLIPPLLGRPRGFFYGNGEAFHVDKALLKGEVQAKKRSRIVRQVALADLVARGTFKLIYVSTMNPALTLPNQNTFREGISRDDVFMAVHETHWSKTAELADLVLPAPTFLEKDDVVVPYGHGYASLAKKVLAPVTDSRTEIWVMQELSRHLGLKDDRLFEDPWKAVRAAMEDALEEGDVEALLSGKQVRLRRRPENHYRTPSGKMEFYSSRAEKAGLNPLPAQGSRDARNDEFCYLASATPRYTHTQFQEIYGDIPPQVHINTREAEGLGIRNGDRVVLSNGGGRVSMEAVISDGVPPGVLWSPRQFSDPDGNPHNALTSSTPQRIGSGPTFNSTRVVLSKS